ncbi:hypothetical protein [Bacteroides sp.]|nr:hypothetical protein [Bacteroides sp.]
MKHILLSALLWCCFFTLHAKDNGSLLFSALLPEPQQISLIEQA